MTKRARPAVDGALAALHGVTRDGQPLSYNRAPAADLAPWIARLYVAAVDAPPDHRLDCGLFNDLPCVRIQLAGQWEVHTCDGPRQYGSTALFAGPQSKRMPISVTGSFVSVGFALRPGSCHVFDGIKMSDHVDRVTETGDFGTTGRAFIEALPEGGSPEELLQALEGVLRRKADEMGRPQIDPITARFEALTLSDPTTSVSDFAREIGIEQRRLERLIRRDFGLAPKQVLRRARALDMASHLRGVADQAEGDELALRYYDQSHLIREFSELFGMSPRQFVAKPQPIMTLGLESRQARRLEAIERLAPGETRPWQAP
jgi:AraC-like DNA-binding protein